LKEKEKKPEKPFKLLKKVLKTEEEEKD